MSKLNHPSIVRTSPASDCAADLEVIRAIEGNDEAKTGLLVSARWIERGGKSTLLVSLYAAEGPVVVSLGQEIDLHPDRDHLYAIRAEKGEA